MARLETILDHADGLGMVPMVGLFYWGQSQRLTDEAAVIRACDQVTDWLLARGYTNVLVEIGNGVDITEFDRDVCYAHAILAAPRSHELIARVQQRSRGHVASPLGRLLVSTSFTGLVTAPVAATADVLLLHGNEIRDPSGLRQLVIQCRALPTYRGQPIVFNEDDHYDFDASDNHLRAAVSQHASWGFYDYRRAGEPWEAGYQDMPTDWGINTERKRQFFDCVHQLTGA